MKCHYEVLGVSFKATAEDLKREYRKLVLKHHPDKNPDNIQEATEKFRAIQQAFDVLNDPQERAWYDKHRDAILKGGRSNYEDHSVDVFQYFNSSCYTGFGDDNKGFYAVYRDVFTRIATEDIEFIENKDSDFEIPSFGRSDSSYEEVVHVFYSYWSSYCTVKTYVWLDEYDILSAPDRRTLRLMEKGNKKIRDQARKKRNEEVRQLVSYVRKRDKRVIAHRKELEEKAAENVRKSEENSMKQMTARKKNMVNYKESEWTSMANLEDELRMLENSLLEQFNERTNGIESSTDEESLYCIACDKYFKSDKTFANHEKSKKHKDNVAYLTKTMQVEEEHYQELRKTSPVDDLETNGLCSEEDNTSVERLKKKKKKKKKKSKAISPQGFHSDSSEEQKEDTCIAETDQVAVETAEINEVPTEKVENDNIQPAERALSVKEKKCTKKAKRLQNKSTEMDSSHSQCSVCWTTFSTRNKLFAHLKESGHAVPIPSNEQGSTREQKRGKR